MAFSFFIYFSGRGLDEELVLLAFYIRGTQPFTGSYYGGMRCDIPLCRLTISYN